MSTVFFMTAPENLRQQLKWNKQKCLVNPAFMQVCSTFKNLLIKIHIRKPLAVGIKLMAKGFLIWIYLLHNRLSIILYHKTTGLQE